MRYSILIPTYRRAESLAATLKSLFTLELRHVEEVMVHVTGEIVHESIDMHCRWLRDKLESLGVQVILVGGFSCLSEAKNAALELTRTEWLLVLDDDVVLNREYADRILGIAARSTEDVMAVTGSVITPFEAGYKEWSLEWSHQIFDQQSTRQNLTVWPDGRVDWGDKVQVYRYSTKSLCGLGYFIGGAVLLRLGDMRFDLEFGRVVYGEEIDYSLQIAGRGGRMLFAAGSECLHFPCPTGGSKPGTEAELVAARQKNFDYLLRKWGLSMAPATGFEARDAAKTGLNLFQTLREPEMDKKQFASIRDLC